MSEGCVFCSILAGTAPAEPVMETDGAFAFMNANPAGPGHALVIPKRHAEDIWDLAPEDGHAVWTLTQRVAHAAREAFHPDGLNLFQTNRRAGWQSVFHFHIHVVPRWTGDAIVPNWTKPQGDRTQIPGAAGRLRTALRTS
jgi:histidine triad (HIT) family protein